MNLDKKDIVGIFDKLKKRAFKAYNSGNYDKCLNYIEISGFIAYKFSWIFKDDDFESLLKKLSISMLKQAKDYTAGKNRYVFYDSFSYDNCGLTLQYIQALISLNVNFLYISESSTQNSYSQKTLLEIMKYEKAEVFEVPKDVNRKEKIEIIYKQIITYRPSKLLMHLRPHSVNALTAFYALPKEIAKYQINLTDHAFWLGVGCLDYTFEFRPYGCALSQNQRKINKDKILLLPNFPIVNEIEFQGLPIETDDKVIIFSGGAYPKILGEDNFFLNLVKQLLLANKGTIFLFAGSGDSSQIEKFITDEKFEKRFILLGHRTDINEVFKHCDIYMSTYPLGGGLMAQFAAINGKPIISYSTFDKIGSWPEETVCQLKKINITKTNIDDFFSETNKLITDSTYRISNGKSLQECVITIDKFNKTLEQTLKNNTNQVQYEIVDVNIDFIFKHSIDVEKSNNELKIALFKELKLGLLFVSSKSLFWIFYYIFTKSFRLKLLRRFKM